MKQVEWICFSNRSGYAQAAQDYIYALKGLNKYDIKVTLLHTLPEQLSMTDKRYQDYMAMIRKERAPGAIQVFHCIPDMQRRVQQAGKSLGFATFETFDPPKPWIEQLNQWNDGVICPSRFNCKVFQYSGVKKPIHYIPHCFDPEMFHPSVTELHPKDERFTFLFFGTWKKRKGYPQLIEAFLQEFDKNDKVRLLIKTDRFTQANKFIDDTKARLGLSQKETAPISFESRILTELEIPRLFKTADCLICPTLGEGFGIPGLQAMALGVPVVITNFSGCTDYASESTATLIEPNKHIVYNDMDGIFQFRNRRWAFVTVDEVRKKMRYVYDNQSEVQQKTLYAREFVKSNFSYPAVAQKMEHMIDSF